MYCKNCGKSLDNNKNYCSNCGIKIENTNENAVYASNDNINKTNYINNYLNQDNTSAINNYDVIKYNKKANVLCTISLILLFIPIIIFIILVNIYSRGYFPPQEFIIIMLISPLIGFVLSIVASSKYKNNSFAKGLLKFYILLIIIGFIAFFVTIIKCIKTCGRMG